MNYFELSECSDTIIKLTEADRQEANQYVEALIVRIGVRVAAITTVPYELKRLAMAVAYRNRALLSSGRGNGVSDVDVYMAKYKAYAAEVKSLEPLITPTLLLGTAQSVTLSPSFSIQRS
ncbi:MAG: hypothetical protein AB9917_13665 [Negativicutes bacterium]